MMPKLFRFGLITALPCVLAAIPATAAEAKVFTSWPIGLEREVDEGYYMTLLSSRDGWRVWRIETESSVECRGIKSVQGQPHPIPLGVSVAFFGGDPFLTVYKGYQDKLRYFWTAEHSGKVTVKGRVSGEKFWKPLAGDDQNEYYVDGRKFQINVTSWEYPAIYVGYAEQTGTMDLTGLAHVIEAVNNCPAPK